MKRSTLIKCRCLYCHQEFYLSAHRLTDFSSGAHRRGVACSNPCRMKLFRGWMLLGMNRDKEYQGYLKERAKLRALVRQAAMIVLVLLMPAFAVAQTCVQADNNHPDSVALTWTDNSTDESGFVLERKQDGGAYAVLVAAVAANLTAFTDSTVKRGSVPTTYTYRIKAYRDSDKAQSAYSNEACITFAATAPAPLPLKPPSGLSTAAASSSVIRITWEDTSAFPGYVLDGKLSRGSDDFTQIVALPSGTATYDWGGRKRYTSYCVRVRGSQADAEYSQMNCTTTTK